MSIPTYPYAQFLPQNSAAVTKDRTLVNQLYYLLQALFLRTGGNGGVVTTVGASVIAAGTTQPTATVLSNDFNIVATGTGGVQLPNVQVGQPVYVFNATAAAINVYPPTGGTVDSLAVNAPYLLAAGVGQIFIGISVNAAGAATFNVFLPSALVGRGIANVVSFGAKGDGTTDDTASIQAAINSLSTTGGIVVFPPGNWKISSTLQIGNGDAAGTGAKSTINQIKLVGLVAWTGIATPQVTGLPATGTCNIQSSVAGPAIKFAGHMQGWGIENLSITFTTVSTSAIGVLIDGGYYGLIDGLAVIGCFGVGIKQTTEGFRNVFRNIFVSMPAASANAVGVNISGAALSSTDVFQDSWHDLRIQPSATTHSGLVVGNCDSLSFFNLRVFNAAAKAIVFDYSVQASVQPTNIHFYDVEIGNNSVANVGSAPASTAGLLNTFTHFSTNNGSAVPSIKNTSAEGYWISYTPTATAQIGAFTTVSAVGSYMIMGQITFIDVEVTVTAVGTATGVIFVSYPPNMPAQNVGTALSYTDNTSATGTAKADPTQMQIIPVNAVSNIAYRASGFVHTV
jgi:hypothetical protein